MNSKPKSTSKKVIRIGAAAERAFAAAATCPPSWHRIPGREFDEAQSEVINWLVAQPAVRDWIFRTMKERAITYDERIGWLGKDHKT